MGTSFAIATDPAGLSALLPWCLAAAALYYVGRVLVAVLLLAVGRTRPSWRSAALACAPATLRPALRRALAGGLLTVALSGSAAMASGPAGCDPAPTGAPLLDRAPTCSAPSQPPPTTAAPPASEGAPAAVGAPASQSPATASDQSPDAGRSSYQVRLGDSLWQIAAHLLGTGADDASVAAAWPELYVANRDAIGADPDVILPGTVLQVPASLLGGTR